MLIFPDGYEFPADFPVDVANGIAEVNNNTATWDSITGSISIDNWSKLESAGVVFLPAAGSRDGSTVYDACGYYWSGTPDVGDASLAYNLNFESYGVYLSGGL